MAFSVSYGSTIENPCQPPSFKLDVQSSNNEQVIFLVDHRTALGEQGDPLRIRLTDRFCKELFAMRRSVEPMQGTSSVDKYFLGQVLSRGGTCEFDGNQLVSVKHPASAYLVYESLPGRLMGAHRELSALLPALGLSASTFFKHCGSPKDAHDLYSDERPVCF